MPRLDLGIQSESPATNLGGDTNDGLEPKALPG